MNIFLPRSEGETEQQRGEGETNGEGARQRNGPGGASFVGNLRRGSLVFHHGLI